MKLFDLLLEQDPSTRGIRSLRKAAASGIEQVKQNRNLSPGERSDLTNPQNVKKQQAELKQQKQTQAVVQQAAGAPQITPDNAMEKIPALMQKYAGDKKFIDSIVSTVATAVSQGSEIWSQALQQASDKTNMKQAGIRGSGQKKPPEAAARDILINISNLPPEAKKVVQGGVAHALQSSGTRKRTNEAVQQQQAPVQQQQQQQQQAPVQQQQQQAPVQQQAPAGGLNAQAQQTILAQIKQAVQGMSREQRKVLKARVQQAALLKGAKPDPNQHMRYGQPVVGRSGIERTGPGAIKRVATGFKKFLKTDVRDLVK